MTAAKNDVFIGLKFLFSGGIDFWCEGGVGVGEFSRLGNEQMFWWGILFTWFCLPFNKFKYPYFSFIKCEVIMVNEIACQKQGAPNQKSKLEVSKRNLLLLMKKS